MKKNFVVFLCLLLSISTVGFSQTLFLPYGTSSIGSTSLPLNGRNGFGISSPQYFLDVSKSGGATWLMHVTNTTNNSHLYFAHGSGHGLVVDAGTNQAANTSAFKVQNTSSTAYFMVSGDGSTIINSSSADYNTRLTIKSGWGNWLSFQNAANTGVWSFHNDQYQNSFQLFHTPAGGSTIFDIIYINDAGKIGFGTRCIPTDGQVAVEGKLYAREVEVNINDWCDFVFEKSYKMMSFDELRSYIEINKHLPDVPTTDEVMTNGLNLGDMDAVLLKKVEELTLYILQLEEQIQLLKEQVNQ